MSGGRRKWWGHSGKLSSTVLKLTAPLLSDPAPMQNACISAPATTEYSQKRPLLITAPNCKQPKFSSTAGQDK